MLPITTDAVIDAPIEEGDRRPDYKKIELEFKRKMCKSSSGRMTS